MAASGQQTARSVDRSGGRGALVLTLVALAIALSCLQLVGRPPAVRHDDLWVHANRVPVRFFLIAVALASVSSAVALLAGGRRFALVILWGAAIAAAIMLFSDRLPIILDVVFRHSVG